MQKIPTVFTRIGGTGRIMTTVTHGCEWVLAGEGWATRKLDGTCCMLRGGVLYKRREIKQGDTPPHSFEAAGPVDLKTGKIQGWMRTNTEDKWHIEAAENAAHSLPDGTYELMGPKIQGNPDQLDAHVLIPHGAERLEGVPRDFRGLKVYLLDRPRMEGIVFYRGNGEMAKIKRKDFTQ